MRGLCLGFYGLFDVARRGINGLLLNLNEATRLVSFCLIFTDLSNLTDFEHNPHLENVKVKFSDNNMREVNFVRRYFG